MRQSELFTKTLREAPKDEEATNAKLLIRAGFIDKTMAGVYSFLPLGLRVINNIEKIVREEINAIGGQEILMPALHPKELWQKTDRWDHFDALLKVVSHFKSEYALGPTHEETIAPLAKKFILSYKDLPFAAYQVQTKFRDEARAKSGLLRGREFKMKDLYSFHRTSDDLLVYYEIAKKVYEKIFARLGLEALLVEASGGTFSKYSHEFQVLSTAGEDVIYHCSCGFSKNKEIMEEKFQALTPGNTGVCPSCGGELHVDAGIEVGNIFQLNTKFTDPFEVKYKDEEGNTQLVYMGCYGIGISRAMGTIVETSHDDRGIVWSDEVAPFRVHLLELKGASGKKLYEDLRKRGIETLYDDRDISAGEKFGDADLIGIPTRIVVSEKLGEKIEIKKRKEKEVTVDTIPQFLKSFK